MVDPAITVTETEWRQAQARTRRAAYLMAAVLLVVVTLLSLTAMWLARLTTNGNTQYIAESTLFVLLLAPVIFCAVRANFAHQKASDHLVGTLANQLSHAVDLAGEEAGHRQRQTDRQQFESLLANALDMADGEPEVVNVIERSFSMAVPESPVELLLADNSHAHLQRMASSPPMSIQPGCAVDAPDRCPAARRAQIQHFPDSGALDACPKLRDRSEGAVSAVCVPVSIMGRTVGVIHATGEPQTSFSDDTVQHLGTLAKLAGARIGLLRVMAETQLQAATDSLTGLLNRRSFEQRLSGVRRETTLLTMAMADLDRFKELNDTHGHETGDRALRLFAQVLKGSVRDQDLICRHGGEEFVIALPGCTTESARKVLNAARGRLEAAITVAGLPKFTVSFGVVESNTDEDLANLIGRADTALFTAKREGRDRVVVNDRLGSPVAPPAEATDAHEPHLTPHRRH
ncbi:MAG: hypothetical protein JWM76_2304 [Pseudonocardiales bacterium]|nr:hypothetical protein [Pseudonocardiales bacterium]